MECDRQNFLSFWTIFCPFTLLTTWKIKILKNEKKKKNPGDIIIFQVYQKWQSYDVWFLRYETKQTEFFCHCGPFLPFYLTNNPKKLKFWKNENTHGGDIILKTQVHQKLWWYAILFLRYSTLDVIIFHFWLFFAHSLL